MNPSTTTTDYRYASVLADLEQILLLGRTAGPIIPVSVNMPLTEGIDADAFASGRSGARSGWMVLTEDRVQGAAPAPAAPSARGRWVPDTQSPGQELWIADETAPIPLAYDGPILEGEILAEPPYEAPDHARPVA